MKWPKIDNELLERFLDGGDDAFNEVVEKYQPFVSAYIKNKMCDYSTVDLEGIEQEVWLRLWKQRKKTYKSSALAFLTKITYGIIVDTQRKIMADNRALNGYKNGFTKSEVSEDGEIIFDPELGNDELCEGVRKVVNSLPEIYAIPLRLQYFKEFSLQEIAETLNIPLGTVKRKIHRAKQLFEEKYNV